MQRHEFDQLFASEIAKPLGDDGFSAQGKSLHYCSGVTVVSFVRLGGRLARPGTAAWVLCFRHSFLRELGDLSIATGPARQVHDYPYTFTPSELQAGRTEWHYHLRLLRYDYDRLDYQALSHEVAARRLHTLAEFIGRRFVPWAESLTPDNAREEIERFGTGGWAEKIWLEDYLKYSESHVA